MRFKPALGLAACFLAAAVSLAACAKKSTTVTTAGGNVTVEQGANGQTTTVKSSEGEMKIGKGAVDPAALGLPIYPGAKQADENSVSLSASSKGEGGQMVMLSTDDSFDKVYGYYKSQMPAGSEKTKVSAGGTQMATFQVGDSGSKDAKTVVIQDSNGKVTIQLVHATKE